MEGIYEFVSSLWVVWLLLLFACVVAYALWPSNRRKFRHASRIPLEDEDDAPGDSAGSRADSKDRNGTAVKDDD